MIGERTRSFPAYVIVRVASPSNSWGAVPPEFAPVGVTVEVENVVLQRNQAEAEVKRLNGRDGEDGRLYHWRQTRIVLPDGGPVS